MGALASLPAGKFGRSLSFIHFLLFTIIFDFFENFMIFRIFEKFVIFLLFCEKIEILNFLKNFDFLKNL